MIWDAHLNQSTFGQHVGHVFAPLPCSMSWQQLPVFVQFCRRLEFVQLHWAALQTAGTCADVHVGQFCRTVLLQQALPVARATTDLTSTPLRFKFLILLIQVFFEVGKCEHVNWWNGVNVRKPRCVCDVLGGQRISGLLACPHLRSHRFESTLGETQRHTNNTTTTFFALLRSTLMTWLFIAMCRLGRWRMGRRKALAVEHLAHPKYLTDQINVFGKYSLSFGCLSAYWVVYGPVHWYRPKTFGIGWDQRDYIFFSGVELFWLR